MNQIDVALEAKALPVQEPSDTQQRLSSKANTIEHLLAVPFRTEAILGELALTVRTISSLQAGSVLRTRRVVGEPLQLRVNSATVATAEVCSPGGKIGLRIVEMQLDTTEE